MARLEHRRNNHMIVFIYNYIRDENMVDEREIHTRRHDGILFKTFPIEHYKVRQDPIVKATLAWNALPLQYLKRTAYCYGAKSL